MGWEADEREEEEVFDTPPCPPDPVAALLRVVERLEGAPDVEELAADAGVVPSADSVESEATTGFTSTVLPAAALLRVVRRRGVEEGVAMTSGMWKRNGNGGERENSLSVRIPVIDNAADRQIGENFIVRTGMPGSGPTGSEDPVALTGTHGVDRNQLFTFVIAQDAQVHVIESSNTKGAHKGSHDLHDFHQLPTPPIGLAGDGAEDDGGADEAWVADEDFGGSGSQWSMIPTIVRSLGYDLLPAASRAAELLTQITQSPGLAPTASTATFLVLPS